MRWREAALAEWRETTLAEVCEEIQYGVTASATPDLKRGPKFLRITDIVPPRIDWDSVPYCELSDEKISKFELRAGDIVVARTGATVGYAKYLRQVPQQAVFASYLVRFRASDCADSAFVGHLVQSSLYKEFVATHSGGSAQPNANAKVLGSFPLLLPDRTSQRRIAAVLSSFDKIIEINERRVELLEDLARSLYQEWFVRFRFPGHEAEELVKSEIGQIPRGWSVAPLEAFAELVVEGVDPSSFQEGERYVGLEHLPRRHTTLQDWGSVESVLSRKLRFSKGDTLFGKIRPNFHKVVWAPFDGLASSDTIVLRPLADRPFMAFVNALASSDRLVAEAVATSNGTKMPRADPKALLAYRIAVPGDELMLEFEHVVGRWIEWSAELVQLNRSLAAIRDLLLPRLVSGRLDISDVDLGILTPAEEG
jgi:type I restriction enzyme, S subunit